LAATTFIHADKKAGFFPGFFIRTYNQNKGNANSGHLLTQRREDAESNSQKWAIFKTLKRFFSALFATLR
jgi:hypothetical protein